MRFLLLLPMLCAVPCLAMSAEQMPEYYWGRVSPVFASTNKAQQSSIRISNIVNDGLATPGDAVVDIAVWDGRDSCKLGVGTLAIPGNASVQFSVSEIERAAHIDPNLSSGTYQVYVKPVVNSIGIQNITWSAFSGFFENLSACYLQFTGNGALVTNVHTSLIADYPSHIVIENHGSFASSKIDAEVYDAKTGALIGIWRVPPVSPEQSLSIPFSTIERDLGFVPMPGQYHVNIKLATRTISSLGDTTRATISYGGSVGVILQHFVENRVIGTLTNMTYVCSANIGRGGFASPIAVAWCPGVVH